MCLRFIQISLLCLAPLSAQLIPSGQPVPVTAKPPVVFVDGYQSTCGSTQFASNFGNFDQLFQATGRVSLFFDNCAFPNKPPIEDLGNGLRDYLAGLRYASGAPVTQVDIVAHSMGGLIVRSYLAGLQTSGALMPPPDPMIRKAVFLAVPNFGSPLANLFGLDQQVVELQDGSIFTFRLATWNQNTDDLRGIDALGLIGNGGTGVAVAPGLDDGVVATTSASIGFAETGRTRIIPYCHTSDSLVFFAGLCLPNTPSIAEGKVATDPNAAATLSFLNDTTDWQSIGQSAEQNAILSANGGLEARAASSTGDFLMISQATAGKDLNIQGSQVAWTAQLPAGPQMLTLTTPEGTLQSAYIQPAGYTLALTAKTGPLINRVLPSAAYVFPLAVAPGTFVAIYGNNLASAPAQASGLPYPVSLGNVQVTVNGSPIGLAYVSANQVNAVMPDSIQGLVTVTLTNSTGSHTVNVLIQPAVPAIYTTNQAGSGPAAALNAVTLAPVTANAPLHPTEYVALYLTGLGAANQPLVTVGGRPCNVTFAGPAPGFPGLDQINCQIDAAAMTGPAVSVFVTAEGRTSNVATLPVQ